MNNKKTGALIAQRRQELGLTQKALGDLLHVSDRAVSKWERAAGFPDVVLLEPLADALGLSVLELIRGERFAVEEQPSSEAERSVRTAIRELGGRLWQRLARLRRGIIVLVILLVAGAVALGYLRFGPVRVVTLKTHEVSAAEALKAVPHAMITADDFAAARGLLEDPEVGGLLVPLPPDSETILPPDAMDSLIAVDDQVVAPYRELLRIGGQAADRVSVEVIYHVVAVSYSCGNRHCSLEIFCDGSIRKTACTYETREALSGEVDGPIVANENNERFVVNRAEWDLLTALRHTLEAR